MIRSSNTQPTPSSGSRPEGGSGSVLVVGIIAAVLALASMTVPLYAVFNARQRATGAADAAALAAADAVVGIVSGAPCELAERLAIANGAQLAVCEVDKTVVTVRVNIVVFGLIVTATATAGPPGT